MGIFYSEMAIEAYENADISEKAVHYEEKEIHGLKASWAKVLSPEGEMAIGRKIGNYYTLELEDFLNRREDSFTRSVCAVRDMMAEILKPFAGKAVLVAGLGNRAITPDALGGKVIDDILVTKHLLDHEKELFKHFYSVAAIATGVLGTTGIESGEIVKSLCAQSSAKVIIAIDALACQRIDRLCKSIQICDTGISPGSGVGNARVALDETTMGLRVIGVGVPTVVDGRNFTDCGEGVIVTTKDIARQVDDISKMLAYGINLALQPSLDLAQLQSLLS